MPALLFRKEKIRTMEQTAAYERLKAVIPIHPADSTKYKDYFHVFHLFANETHKLKSDRQNIKVVEVLIVAMALCFREKDRLSRKHLLELGIRYIKWEIGDNDCQII